MAPQRQSSPKGSSQWKQTSRIPAVDEHIQRWPSPSVPHLLDFLSPRTHTDNLNISNHYMGAQMTQSTPPASSPHSSDSSEATRHIGSSSMHMGRLPGLEPAYIPYPGYATYHPYGVPPHWTRGPAPQYTPVVPSTDAGAGVAHHAFQAGQNGHYPPAVDVSRATQIGQYLPPNVAAPPPARTLYHQHFPSIPGVANPYAYALPIPHQGIFDQHHGPELSMGSASSSLPQAPSCQVRRRCKAKKSTTSLHKIYSDPLFKPVVDEYGQPTGKFVCSIDGGEIGLHGYRRHTISIKHQGSKLKRIKCSVCSKSYTRSDSYKRHLDNGTCERATAVVAPPSASQDSGSSASPAPVAAPTMVFAYACPYPRFAPPMSQNAQSGTPSFTTSVNVSQLEEEEDEEEDDSDFWEANEI